MGTLFRRGTSTLLVAVVVASPAGGLAQAPEDACDYDACALRVISRGWLSSPAVVRGLGGEEVARYGAGPVLERLFAAHDSAATHYAAFARYQRRQRSLGLVGGALVLAGLTLQVTSDADDSPWGVGLAAAGGALGLLRIPVRRHARSHFSQAVWWYNRSLEPSAPERR